ncbi:MAG: ABC transporter permease [Oscillospiraceae bacterium]|nr:ABC transporter permease [Oscillospiraceae bacterium]
MRGNFDNSVSLIRFILRRERVISAVWVVLLVLFSAGLAPGINGMFPDDASRSQFALSYDNPVMISMMGPAYGIENYTPGAMYTGMMLLWVAITACVMNIFFVVRHTRADEERGRVEVVRSLPTGRLANLNATMVSAVIINAVIALLIGFGLAAAGIESIDLAGGMLFGALVGLAGLVFAALAALFSQLSSSAGGAMGMSFLALGGLYLLRGAGDMQGSDAISCISPLGLILRSQAYIQNRLWPVFILVLEVIIISAAAYKLNSIRDMDQGFIAAKPGRKEAKPGLLSPLGLAYRLMRTMLIAWIITMLMLGASYGSVIGEIGSFVGDSPEYLTVIGIPPEIADGMTDADKQDIISSYFGLFVNSIMALICIVPLLNAAMKPRSEEREGRSEHVLSRVVSRVKYLAGYISISYAASVLFPIATALGLYSSVAAVSGDSIPPSFELGSLLKANLAYLPAMWVIIGAAVLAVGLFPKASGAIWGYYGFICFAALFGNLPDLLPEWISKLSPMSYIPRFPLDDISFAPLAVLALIAAALTAIGFVSYARRDYRP